MIAFNPAFPVTLKKRRHEEMDDELWPLTKIEQLQNGEQKVVAVSWRPMIVTAIFSGLRASGPRSLGWSHVNVAAGVIQVRRRADCFNAMGPPTSKAGRRDVPLPPVVVRTLKEWRLACS